MNQRRRKRLVPTDAVEAFEIRTALFFTEDGDAKVAFEISRPDDPEDRPPLHEVLGLLDFAALCIIDDYNAE